MGSNKNLFLLVTMVLVSFFLNSPTYAKEEKKPAKRAAADEAEKPEKPSDQYKLINDFCNERSTKEDRSFCTLVFEPNPKTATVKNSLTFLKVAIEFATGNAMKTHDFLSFMSEDKATKPPMKPVLKQCITAYNNYIKDLQVIIGDLEDDPPMASYDARMATEALSRCHNSLTAGKINDDTILGRIKVAVQYSKLVEEISKIV